MGSEESTSTKKQSGYRIYQLMPNGPLHQAGLHEFSDFILPPEDKSRDDKKFSDWLKEKAGQKIQISVYSLLTRKIKQYDIQTNSPDCKDGQLGASVRYESYTNAHKKLLRVTKVNLNSFAQIQLNLEEQEDFLIGMRPEKSEIMSLNSERGTPLELFAAMLRVNAGKECDFYIYSTKTGPRITNATIENDESFTLGCDVAYGVLHEFPMIKDNDENDIEMKKLIEESGQTQYI